jgi:hypothetical protein
MRACGELPAAAGAESRDILRSILPHTRGAAPRHPQLSIIAAWYISPGQGRALKITLRRFHEGRSFAAVRTEIKNADGARVLEVVSHHAA